MNLKLVKIIDVEKIDSQGGSIRCYISKKNFNIKKNKKINIILA